MGKTLLKVIKLEKFYEKKFMNMDQKLLKCSQLLIMILPLGIYHIKEINRYIQIFMYRMFIIVIVKN